MSVRTLFGFLLALFLAWFPKPPAQAQPPWTTPEELERVVLEQRRVLDEATAALRANPEAEELWRHWFTRRTLLYAVESQRVGEDLQSLDPVIAEQQHRDRIARWFDGWRQEFPKNPALEYLHFAILGAPEERAEDLQRLRRQFPEDLAITEQLFSTLAARGEKREAIEVANAFLERNPPEPTLYSRIHRRYLELGDSQGAAATIDAWLEALPGDDQANLLWLEKERRFLTADELHSTYRQITARLDGKAKARWCSHLSDSEHGLDAALDCFREIVPELDPDGSGYEHTLSRYAGALRQAGDLGTFHQIFERLPLEQRETLQHRMLRHLVGSHQCSDASALLATFTDPGRALAASGRLQTCLGETSFLEQTLSALSHTDPNTAQRLLDQASEDWPVERLEALIHQREDLDEKQTFRWLERLYEKTGRDDKRFALLERWQRQFPGQDGDRMVDLADFYLEKDRVEDAIRVLEAFIDEGLEQHFEPLEILVALYVDQKRPEAGMELAERYFARDGLEGSFGALLLARLAMAKGDLEAARGSYETFYEDAPVALWKEAEDYQRLLLELDDQPGLIAHLGRQWQARVEAHQGDGKARTEWVGEQLEQLGLGEQALDLYEQQLAESGGSAALFDKAAALAEELKAWERALDLRHKRLKLAPEEPQTWRQLAEHFLARQQVEKAFEVLDQAFDQLPKPDVSLWHLWADAVLKIDRDGDQIPEANVHEAIEVLRQAVEVFDERVYDKHLLSRRLSTLYLHLERRHQPTEETAPSSGVKSPEETTDTVSPSQARTLLLRADEFNSGSAGQLDLAAARDLYQKAAATKDPVAVLRFATLLHLGTVGFVQDRDRAAELATGQFDPVRQLAAKGDAKAQYVFGTALLVGVGGEAQPELALDWLKRSAAGGESWAMFNLGWMYASGTGVRSHLETAFGWYEQAAEAGHVDAMWNLGWRRLHAGYGERQEAVDWLHQAAEKGQLPAQRMLAESYDLARNGFPRDPEQALHWYRKAAEQGDEVARGWLRAQMPKGASSVSQIVPPEA